MGRRAKDARKELVELLEGRPGWRLEPRSTPGASPLWCFVSGGEIECSVAAEDGAIHLYVMSTDKELVFRDAAELTAWLQEHRADAFEDRPRRLAGKERHRRYFEWS
jgi:hypothetical protein